MTIETDNAELISILEDKATRLRIDSIRATTEAGSGHPTSCCSAADVVAALFFAVMRYDPAAPKNPANDVFILSKGHAAPVLYAAWAEAGYLKPEELLHLRKITSDLEGHPTPRLAFVDVATGSLGQGLPVGVGMALEGKLDRAGRRIYVLLGDGESAEGSVWEAAETASHYKLGNLCATIDINRLGQSEPTMLQHDMETYAARWRAFGWQPLIVDGHDIPALLRAYDRAAQTAERPTVVLARTLKGRGISFAEDLNGWHGRALKKEEAERAIQALEARLSGFGARWRAKGPAPAAGAGPDGTGAAATMAKPPYQPGDSVATREAFGAALAALGAANPRVVALDGDVKNSTYSEEFQKKFPERFFQGFIAEQNLVGASMGLAARGKIPFVATFACFLTRAFDFVRMAAISHTNIKLVGTHAGISIGEDGPSQMGLEDLAMACAEPNFTVLYPSDAVAAWRAMEAAAAVNGPVYVRAARPKTPVIYGAEEKFEIGKCKVLRSSAKDRATIVAAGVTVFEALEAHQRLAREGIAARVIDLYSVQPIDREGLREAARATGGIVITVEDHYAHGGIGDAVGAALAQERAAVHKLAVREIPRSGKPAELLEKFGISASAIVEAVKKAAR
ncbi:MAG TPA: transketolase [Bryobacterales bacterium]|nr:transketolase [Bryobacterales bacterium]